MIGGYVNSHFTTLVLKKFALTQFPTISFDKNVHLHKSHCRIILPPTWNFPWPHQTNLKNIKILKVFFLMLLYLCIVLSSYFISYFEILANKKALNPPPHPWNFLFFLCFFLHHAIKNSNNYFCSSHLLFYPSCFVICTNKN